MKLVIDTSLLIDHLRGGMAWKIFLNELEKEVDLFIPTIVFFELFSGKSTQDESIVSAISKLIRNFQKIELDEKIARRAGELYRDMAVKIQVPDYIIAASALEIGGKVVTLNRKHFENISGLSLYPL